jgi:hypothetical protein
MTTSFRLCGGCCHDAEFLHLHTVEGPSAACARCGFPTHLVFTDPESVPEPDACTAETHALLRTDVDLFEAAIVGRAVWGDLLVGNCRLCSSTLALQLCGVCNEATPSGDQLPYVDRKGEDRVGHFACLVRRAIRHRKMTIAGEVVQP